MDINKWSVDGITPIMVAAIEGHDLAVEQLLIKGARLDICDKDDRSVVFHAAKENQGQVLKRLLGSAEGRDLIEVTDQFDNLPIHVAAKGQLISKCPFGVIVWTNIPTKFGILKETIIS